ncbi:hypothetical protein ACN24K_01990 [Streptomyces microflavus]
MTPSIRLSFFSTRAAHEAHVMPPIMSSAPVAFAAGVPAAAVLAMSELLGNAGRAVPHQYLLAGPARR